MNGIDLSSLLDSSQLLLGTSFSVLQIFLSLSITFLIAIFIFFTYKKTYNGVLYSKNFNSTLVVVALIVNALMIGISGNLVLSLGLVGALSIVRFRTAVKDPKDTAYIFWAISIGVINGVGYYELSILASLFVAVVLYFLSKTSPFEASYMLILKHNEQAFQEIKPILQNEFKSFFIRTDSKKAEVSEKVVEVRLKKNNYEHCLKSLRDINGVVSCTLLASNGEFAE